MGWFPHPAVLPFCLGISIPQSHSTNGLPVSPGWPERWLEFDNFQGLQKCCLDVFSCKHDIGIRKNCMKNQSARAGISPSGLHSSIWILKAHLFCIGQTGNWYKATPGTYNFLYVHWLGFKAAVDRHRLRGHLIPQAHQLLLSSSPLDFNFLISLLALKQFFSHFSKSLSGVCKGLGLCFEPVPQFLRVLLLCHLYCPVTPGTQKQCSGESEHFQLWDCKESHQGSAPSDFN